MLQNVSFFSCVFFFIILQHKAKRKKNAKKEIKATKKQKQKKGNKKLLRKMIRLKHLKIEEQYPKT